MDMVSKVSHGWRLNKYLEVWDFKTRDILSWPHVILTPIPGHVIGTHVHTTQGVRKPADSTLMNRPSTFMGAILPHLPQPYCPRFSEGGTPQPPSKYKPWFWPLVAFPSDWFSFWCSPHQWAFTSPPCVHTQEFTWLNIITTYSLSPLIHITIRALNELQPWNYLNWYMQVSYITYIWFWKSRWVLVISPKWAEEHLAMPA